MREVLQFLPIFITLYQFQIDKCSSPKNIDADCVLAAGPNFDRPPRCSLLSMLPPPPPLPPQQQQQQQPTMLFLLAVPLFSSSSSSSCVVGLLPLLLCRLLEIRATAEAANTQQQSSQRCSKRKTRRRCRAPVLESTREVAAVVGARKDDWHQYFWRGDLSLYFLLLPTLYNSLPLLFTTLYQSFSLLKLFFALFHFFKLKKRKICLARVSSL